MTINAIRVGLPVPEYENLVDLPVPDADGQLAFVKAVLGLYFFNGISWVLAGGGGGAGSINLIGGVLGVGTIPGVVSTIVNGAQAAIQTKVYVRSHEGVDTLGTESGSVLAPYKTISFALAQINALAVTTPCVIDAVGNFTESLIIYPNVSIIGNNMSTLNIGSTTVDASWATNGGFFILNGFNLNITSPLTLDFSTSNASSISNILINEINTLNGTSTINIIGQPAGSTFVSIANVNGVTGQANINFQDVYLTLFDSFLQNYSYVVSVSAIVDFIAIVSAMVWTAGSWNNLSTTVLEAVVLSSPNLGSHTVNGNIELVIDSDSITIASNPVLTGGATITYLTISNGIIANYTPVNYTPTSPQIPGHLQGIDNALGTGTPASLPAKEIGFGSPLNLLSGTANFNYDSANGFMGLNVAVAHSALQFKNDLNQRIITLAEIVDNFHQYIGFGTLGSVDPETMVLQTASSTVGRFIWQAGIDASNSLLLAELKASDGSLSLPVGGLLLKTTGGTPTLLDFYQKETITFSISGAIAATTIDITFTRIGSAVTMSWPDLSAAQISNTTIASSTVVPVRYRPSASTWMGISVIHGPTSVTIAQGYISILSGGAIVFAPNILTLPIDNPASAIIRGTYTSTNAGIVRGSISYSV